MTSSLFSYTHLHHPYFKKTKSVFLIRNYNFFPHVSLHVPFPPLCLTYMPKKSHLNNEYIFFLKVTTQIQNTT